MKSRHCM